MTGSFANVRRARATFIVGAVAFVALRLERGLVGAGAEGTPRVEGEIDVPDRVEKFATIEGLPVCRMHVAVGVDERRLRVEDQPVEIENERANHAPDENDTREKQKRRVAAAAAAGATNSRRLCRPGGEI